jgi:hypothetical protein
MVFQSTGAVFAEVLPNPRGSITEMKILRRFNTLDGVVLRVSTNVTIHSSRNQ